MTARKGYVTALTVLKMAYSTNKYAERTMLSRKQKIAKPIPINRRYVHKILRETFYVPTIQWGTALMILQ